MSISQQWRWEAACKDPPKGWSLVGWKAAFYDAEGERRVPIPQIVRDTCESCPVHRECLLHAVASEEYGFWAGTSAKQRRRLRRGVKVQLQTVPRR